MKISRDTALTLATFLTLVAAFYVLGYWLIYRMGQATPLMLSVGMATVFTCVLRKRSLSSLGWGWGSSQSQWMSYLIPFAIAFSAYVIVWLVGFGDFYNADFVSEQREGYNLSSWSDASVIVFHFILIASISFFVSLPSILGEEIGWRGFLVPELSKFMPFTGVAIVSGLVWSLFHWPLILLGLYGNDVTPLYYQLLFFTLFITSTGIIMAYLRLKTGNLWTAVIYHGSSNIFIQKFFTPITAQNSQSSWFIDEFGAVTALVTFAVAMFFLRRGIIELGATPSSRGI